MQHFTEQQLWLYAAQKLAAYELLDLSDHLQVCVLCSERLQNVLQANPGGQGAVNFDLSELTAEGEALDAHLSYEQLARYVDAQADEAEQEISQSHVEFCPSCHIELQDMLAFQQSLRH